MNIYPQLFRMVWSDRVVLQDAFGNGRSPMSLILPMSEAADDPWPDLENWPIDWNNFLPFSLYEFTCSFVPDADCAAPWYDIPYLWNSTKKSSEFNKFPLEKIAQ